MAPSPMSPTSAPPLASQACADNDGRAAVTSAGLDSGWALACAAGRGGSCAGLEAPPQPAKLALSAQTTGIGNFSMVESV